jgi:hypothetical protein
MKKMKVILVVEFLLVSCTMMTKVERDQLARISKSQNLEEVTSALTSPRLIDLYVRSNFRYEYYLGSQKTIEEVFKSKRANCQDSSKFTVYCLTKAGYSNSGLLSVTDSRYPEGHVIAYFWDGENIFIIDNGLREPLGLLGPYKSFYKIPYKVRARVH